MTELKERKILVVDDDLSIVKLLELKLKEWGYSVITTTDPNQCFQIVKEEHPHLVLLDLMMPGFGLDGISVCSKLKQTYEIPVIMITALDSSSTRHDAALFGVSEYITKPIDFSELKYKIEKVLKNKE